MSRFKRLFFGLIKISFGIALAAIGLLLWILTFHGIFFAYGASFIIYQIMECLRALTGKPPMEKTFWDFADTRIVSLEARFSKRTQTLLPLYILIGTILIVASYAIYIYINIYY